MKKKFEITKYTDFYEKNKKYFPYLALGLVVLIFSLLTFFALFPFTDKSQVDKGKQRVQELQINFDQKIIKDLEAKQKPAEISGTGGRDPFSRF